MCAVLILVPKRDDVSDIGSLPSLVMVLSYTPILRQSVAWLEV